jgi:hypothetical protein
MWKFVVVLLLTAIAILVAQLVSDAPVPDARRRGKCCASHLCLCRYPGVRG